MSGGARFRDRHDGINGKPRGSFDQEGGAPPPSQGGGSPRHLQGTQNMKTIYFILMAGLSTSAVAANGQHHAAPAPRANQYYGAVHMQAPGETALAWPRYSPSGTEDREGLGADPRAPEGPGNVDE